VVLGVRQSRKQATRERVLAAARDLFEEVGYDDATIREVAQRAQVSVGSVFTTFSGKAEILSQVMDDRLDGLYAELDQVIPHLRGPTVDRLRSIMAVHYGFETRRVRLFVAYIGASYSWSPGEGVVPLGRNERLKSMLRDALAGGVERGEVRPDADLRRHLAGGLYLELSARIARPRRRAGTDRSDGPADRFVVRRRGGALTRPSFQSDAAPM
jgi:AcrR family transcriptional regulator